MSSQSTPTFPAAPTPAMRQYLDAKRQHPGAILFFRMGDFYEMFFDDALTAARALELTLTSRSKDGGGAPIPMCGVPFHAADGYVARLVRKGFRVAICEQVENPRQAKGVVKREVVRVVSPGTLIDADYLQAEQPSFLMAVATAPVRGSEEGAVLGMALLDVSTGEFVAAECPADEAGRRSVVEEIAVLGPREILLPDGEDPLPVAELAAHTLITRLDGWQFGLEHATESLTDQLQTRSLTAFGLDGHGAAVRAAGAVVQYLRDTQKADLAHVRTIAFRDRHESLVMDQATVRHLEIVDSVNGDRGLSLLGVLDETRTAMGARLLRSWLLRPLVALEPIQDRLDAVEDLAFRATERAKVRDTLRAVLDVERLVSRAALGSAGPRDLVALGRSLAAVPRLRMVVGELGAPLLQSVAAGLDDLPDVKEAITATLIDEPPALARDGGSVRDGVDPELDELRTISRTGRQHIAEMERAERERTGIGSLKIRYNRVFGYYIEVSRANLHAVPEDYQRRQTIAGGERFVTVTLKEYEEKVLGADERILERELALFEALRVRVAAESTRLLAVARTLATLDVLASLAEVAAIGDYTKPHLHAGEELTIGDGRHPVVERTAGHAFVPNDLDLDGRERQLVILTGPNMGGKSTFLRQTALISVMAQIGSFVPARQAKLPIVDRLYARVGASDNIARGQSTFMLEMEETARILHTATSRSLVVLDEIGRGTATYDGLSIAWAVAEHLVSAPGCRPKTLFATHYHELTDLADATGGVVNYHVVAREWEDRIVFLRKVVPGRSDRSYGIQVARLAGLPAAVVERAREILRALERDELTKAGRPAMSDPPTADQRQLGLFEGGATREGRLVERLRGIEPDQMTPLEALTLVAELKREAGA